MSIPSIKTVVSSQKTRLMTYWYYKQLVCIHGGGAVKGLHCKAYVTRQPQSSGKWHPIRWFVANHQPFVSRDFSTVLEVSWHDEHPGNTSRKNSGFVWGLLTLYKIRYGQGLF